MQNVIEYSLSRNKTYRVRLLREDGALVHVLAVWDRMGSFAAVKRFARDNDAILREVA